MSVLSAIGCLTVSGLRRVLPVRHKPVPDRSLVWELERREHVCQAFCSHPVNLRAVLGGARPACASIVAGHLDCAATLAPGGRVTRSLLAGVCLRS